MGGRRTSSTGLRGARASERSLIAGEVIGWGRTHQTGGLWLYLLLCVEFWGRVGCRHPLRSRAHGCAVCVVSDWTSYRAQFIDSSSARAHARTHTYSINYTVGWHWAMWHCELGRECASREPAD